MIKNIKIKIRIVIGLLFCFSLLGNIYAQEGANPNVELPDFVITGTDVVNIQTAQKIKPGIISTVSQSFLKPAYSPEELEVRDLSNPVKDEIQLFDTLNFLKGNIKAGAGVYMLPKAELSYAFPFKSGIMEALAWGYNQRNYGDVDIHSRFLAGGAANLSFFVDNESPFLPGMQFRLHGDYELFSYKGVLPTGIEERKSNIGNIGLRMQNLLNPVIIYGVNFTDDFTSLQDEDFSENLLNVNGFTKLELANFSLAGNAEFKSQSITNSTLESGEYTFLGVRPTIGLVFSEVLKASFGFNYQKVSENSFFAPYASLALKLDRSLTLFGQFTPQAEFLTAGDFLKANPYLDVQRTTNLFVENQGMFKASIKYEYDKYFQIDGGVEYKASENMPYFETYLTGPEDNGGTYVSTTDAKSYTGFINFLFHPGPYGVFYGSVEFNRTTDTTNSVLPYHPAITANLVYGYNFPVGLYAETTLDFNSSAYPSLNNSEANQLPAYVDLGINLSYKAATNFWLTLELNNLLNRDNYLWYGYREIPLDIVAGINYKW